MDERAGGASAGAIQHHYDVGNSFYRSWLDASMTYSGAMWSGADTLEDAQRQKLDYHVGAARAEGADRVLDVGCGWGSLLDRLTSAHGVRSAIGLTLSEAQAAHIQSLGIPAEVRLESWADHEPQSQYDAIISIGALEHFARVDVPTEEKIANYRRFFSRCHHWLRPGGRISLQAIAYGNLKRDDFRGTFITEKIFPESDFVRLPELFAASEFLFEVETLRNDPLDYELTCREWLARFQENREEIVATAGAEKTELWERYLVACVRGWQIHATNLIRMTMVRIENPRVPPEA